MIKEEQLRDVVDQAVADARIVDVHTHLYSEEFGDLLLWGIDELLTYHYLVAETFRWLDLPYEKFWAMSKKEQADLIWQTLFVENTPYSEACRGVLTVLDKLGLDVSARDLSAYRQYFAEVSLTDYIDKVFESAKIDYVVMTNDPFDPAERAFWLEKTPQDNRFRAALRIDAMLSNWTEACNTLQGLGYSVSRNLDSSTLAEVRRFLEEWTGKMEALYMAASLPPTFVFPEDSARGTLIQECVLPVCRELNIPFAMMIGVKKLVNPGLRLAGDSVGKGDIDTIEYLCANYPKNKFMLTMLARENQHELCVAARKYRNLMIFGCWWFLNNPSLVDEITRMRFELLGESVIPQHSDARVLDQLIYKWDHSKKLIANVLYDKYRDLIATGWQLSEEEIRRDVSKLFRRNFSTFLQR